MLNRRSFFAASAAGIAGAVLPVLPGGAVYGPSPIAAAMPAFFTMEELKKMIVEHYTPIFAAGFQAAWNREAISGNGRVD